jgi:hypothetical protein
MRRRRRTACSGFALASTNRLKKVTKVRFGNLFYCALTLVRLTVLIIQSDLENRVGFVLPRMD